jgi:hypothetical protein
MAARKQTAIVGLKVRLREPLRKKLETAAKKKGVSLNAELVARLEESFLGEGLLERMEPVFAALDKRIAQLEDMASWASSKEEDLRDAIRDAERET